MQEEEELDLTNLLPVSIPQCKVAGSLSRAEYEGSMIGNLPPLHSSPHHEWFYTSAAGKQEEIKQEWEGAKPFDFTQMENAEMA